MAIAHIPIHTNPPLRPSRLHKGMGNFIWRQGGTIIRSYVLYQPLQSFVWLGIPFIGIGGFLIGRFLVYYLAGDAGVGRYLQSISIGGTMLIFGIFLIFLGLLGDAVRANRAVIEEVLIRMREQSSTTGGLPNEINGSQILRRETYKDKDGA
jgi:hypothetical protein